MNVKEKAKVFAINAHKGQVRKSEPDKPMIIHPIGVAKILEEYGCDENVIAAGYLHDVVEDTDYSIEDIKAEFGDDIANLVLSATEEDKTLSWEIRKEKAIKKIKKISLRNKYVICADKINNLEDLLSKFQKSGKRDFSAFRRGEASQCWFYRNVYESLIYGEDKNEPIFLRLKDVIDRVFYNKEDMFLKEEIFNDNLEYYEQLKKLHAQKVEIKKISSLVDLQKPYIIEFSGTPRTGKTTLINNLYDFFKKGGFNITLIEEFTTSKYYKERFSPKISKLSKWNSNMAIVEEVAVQLLNATSLKDDIVLIDRSINDRQIWNYRIFKRGLVTKPIYLEKVEEYKKISKNCIDALVVSYASPDISLKRDYQNSLALEERRFLNIENINEYNNCLMEVKAVLEDSVDNCILVDTSYKSINEVSIFVASEIMVAMRKKYIETFKNELEKYIT